MAIEYTINKLARMSGVSTRTLRYYDEIGLLKPARSASSGYRIYGAQQVDTLQQILFYRELDFSLEDIRLLLSSADFDRGEAFTNHLTALEQKRERLDKLIMNVKKSMTVMKGEAKMSDQEKFAGFKQALINENAEKYGADIREKYGNKTVDESNAKLMGLTKEQYEEGERIRLEFEDMLKVAFETGDPASDSAKKACELHKQWLKVFYPQYTREYHLGLANMYVADERFRANYDKLGDGCTEFLREAIKSYLL